MLILPCPVIVDVGGEGGGCWGGGECCACVCVRLFVCVHTGVVCAHACGCGGVCMHMHICVCVYMHVWLWFVCVYMHVCNSMWLWFVCTCAAVVCVCMHVCVCMLAYVSMYVLAYVFVCAVITALWMGLEMMALCQTPWPGIACCYQLPSGCVWLSSPHWALKTRRLLPRSVSGLFCCCPVASFTVVIFGIQSRVMASCVGDWEQSGQPQFSERSQCSRILKKL